ncbi:hypothetical protein [Microcoleus sp. FACHB-672]|nr:hypothetical protein [Microcoleus sp. FACHB-672]
MNFCTNRSRGQDEPAFEEAQPRQKNEKVLSSAAEETFWQD